ncbi:hypothetical protein CHS0354_031166 [Potamilus streckersoni]|uniref:Uncharacterized protein n=1 Tax=Potamilus streckersoni TaxID=2493646 RepID=A0AAE0TKE2_9BIVA|nr:hypothetical protein CHS0354_031166 [Potamilus streckersoni]
MSSQLNLSLSSGEAVPSSPRNVTIQVKPHHLLVTWDPPIETYGEVTMYIVSYSILPDSRITTNNVGGGSSFSLIPVEGQDGRLLKIQVQAQNQVGIGNMSTTRYVRIGCGRTFWLDPSASTSLLYPEMGTTYSAGVLCKWTLSTNDTYSLTFMFATIQLGEYSNELCIDAYVRIGNEGRFCHAQEQGKYIVSRDSNVTVIFTSGTGATGTGFYLNIMSRVKIPGPPSSITMKSSVKAILLTWAPPAELTLPITSYVIHYSVLPDGPALSIVLGPNKFYFAIGTTRFEGKLLVISITARTESIQGDASKPLYVRAACHRTIDVDPGVATNISSPNYPSQYPAGIICTWSIRTNMEATVSAKFLDFQLQDSSFCSSDYITLSINPDQRLCGVITPSGTFETGSTLDIKFVSDGEKQERGFLLQIQSKGSQRVSIRGNNGSEQLFSSTQILTTSPAPKLQTTKTTKATNDDFTAMGKAILTSSTLLIPISAITSPLLSTPQPVSKPLSPSTSSVALITSQTNNYQPDPAVLSTRTPLLSFEIITESTEVSSSESTIYSLVNLSINTKGLQGNGQSTSSRSG